jgi:aspartate aminotransferase-like enzyme
MEDLRPKKTHLFTPGPTPVPDAVLRAMSAPVIHHRTPAFQEILGRTLPGVAKVMGTANPVAMFTSSGTGAMESAVVNLVSPGDEVVVAAFGHFGKRWADIAGAYGATVHLHETPWGSRPDPDAVGQFVAQYPNARVVFSTHSETSTGTVSDAEALAASIRQQGGDDRILVLDAISSLGASRVEADTWGWDVVVAGSQKALMVVPGLAFASVSSRAREHAKNNSSSSFYWNWEKNLNAHAKDPASTAFTPALSIVIGLDVALSMMFDEGLDNVYARHIEFGRAVRSAIGALGFDLFSPDDDSSCVLTAAAVPEDIDGTRIPAKLREYGVTIAGGQAHLKGRIFRVGHCGWVNALDIVLAIAALERGLTEIGIEIEPGAGVAAVQRELVGRLQGVRS